MEIRNTNLFNAPRKLKSNPDNRDKSQYCLFHRDHGHSTRNCIQLKDEIEGLIRNGYLKEFTTKAEADQRRPRQRQGWTSIGNPLRTKTDSPMVEAEAKAEPYHTSC